MGRFPFYMELEERKILIVGGGAVACRRARRLMPFRPALRLVAPEIDLEPGDGVECVRRPFCAEDLEDVEMVIAATDDHALNARIAALCRARGIEVNAVDAPALSTFHFPAVLQRGGMTVSVSSETGSPIAAQYIRDRIEHAIPGNFGQVLAAMAEARRLAQEILPQERRAEALRRIFERCLEPREIPDSAEIESMIRCVLCTELD